MEILRRIRNAIEARINELLDRVEDPETKIDQLIMDLELSLVEMRKRAASGIAAEKLTSKKLDRTWNEAETWEKDAEDALRQNDEALARRALLRKIALEHRASDLDSRLGEANETAARMKDLLSSTELKVADVKNRREILVSKMRAVAAKGRVNDALMQFNRELDCTVTTATGILRGFEEFDRFEEEIERISAEVDVAEELSGEDLERTFEKMKQQKAIEDELRALRKKVRG